MTRKEGKDGSKETELMTWERNRIDIHERCVQRDSALFNCSWWHHLIHLNAEQSYFHEIRFFSLRVFIPKKRARLRDSCQKGWTILHSARYFMCLSIFHLILHLPSLCLKSSTLAISVCSRSHINNWVLMDTVYGKVSAFRTRVQKRLLELRDYRLFVPNIAFPLR
jgi:hypothetical protein